MVFGRVTWSIYVVASILFGSVGTSSQTCEKEEAPSSITCDNDRLYIIRSTHSTAFVLDGTDSSQVRVQPFTSCSVQFWRFETGNIMGLFYIVNDHSGLVLDFKSDDSVILAPKTGNLSQQWSFGVHNNSGKITTAAKVANLDITGQRFKAGDPVGVWFDGDYPNQKWKAWEKV